MPFARRNRLLALTFLSAMIAAACADILGFEEGKLPPPVSCKFETGVSFAHLVNDIILLPDGSFVAVGQFFGPLTDPCTEGCTSNGRKDLFVARIHTDSSNSWVKTFGGPGDDNAQAVAVRGDEILVAGSCSGFDLAGSNLGNSEDDIESCVISLRRMDGTPLWAHSVNRASTGSSRATAIAVSEQGPAFVTMRSSGNESISRYPSAGSTTLPSAQYDLTTDSYHSVFFNDVAVGANKVFVVGTHTGNAPLDLGSVQLENPCGNQYGIMLALDHDLSTVHWARSFPAKGGLEPKGIVLWDGDPVVVGSAAGTVYLDGSTVGCGGGGSSGTGAARVAGMQSGFVLRLSAMTGHATRWARLLGDPTRDTDSARATDIAASSNRILIVGSLDDQTANFPGDYSDATGERDGFLLSLDGEGNPTSLSLITGGPLASVQLNAVAATPSGCRAVGGGYRNSVEGLGPWDLDPSSEQSGFAGTLSP